MSKKYGLIKKDSTTSRPAAFDTDSDSDEAAKTKNIGTQGPGANQKRLAKIAQEKALAEDPTVFQYDELYDDMSTKRKEEKSSKSKQDKKPKYINKLLETAEKRKKENERRTERQVQKEREAEGEQFKDKEQFVTSAYRAKLEEMREADEAEKREEYLEAVGDVTKQSNLDGFYRHIYEQKTGDKKSDEKSEMIVEKKAKKEQTPEKDDSEPEERKSSQKDRKTRKKEDKKSRSYRKRNSSNNKNNEGSDNSDGDPEPDSKKSKKHIQSNLDADSDFEIDSSSESEREEKPQPKAEPPKREEAKPETNGGAQNDDKPVKNGAKKPKSDNSEDSSDDQSEKKVEVKAPVVKKPKVDVWKKHTVGEVFVDAQQRFYARKAAREAEAASG